MNAEIFGYKIEDLHNPAPGKIGYHLTGKRGAIYRLMRHQNKVKKQFPDLTAGEFNRREC